MYRFIVSLVPGLDHRFFCLLCKHPFLGYHTRKKALYKVHGELDVLLDSTIVGEMDAELVYQHS